MIKELLHFLDESPTAFGSVKNIRSILETHGYVCLEDQPIVKGGKYYLTRNGSSIIAFNAGRDLGDPALHLCASHTDSPVFKLKPNPFNVTANGIRLNIEPYGGLLKRPWFDRPLALAGRIIIREDDRISSSVFIGKEPFCVIPSMAPHLDRDAEDRKIDVLKDMAPVVTLDSDLSFEDYLAQKSGIAKEKIAGFDLYLYPLHAGFIWGKGEEFFTAARIDDLECAYTSLMGFLDNFQDDNINMYAAFDNEEVGSRTRQGAASDLLVNLIDRICRDLDLDRFMLLKQTIMLSADNAHGLHPDHTDLYDGDNTPKLNGGVVIKYNAAQSYCTDALSSALFMKVLDEKGIPHQVYANKTGIKGGGTLGNIANSHVSVLSVDIGLAQWAMHSPVETAGCKDVGYMIDALRAFYQSHVHYLSDGDYLI